MGSTIFVIDSSPAVHRMVEQISAPEGHKVMGFSDGPSALDAARSTARPGPTPTAQPTPPSAGVPTSVSTSASTTAPLEQPALEELDPVALRRWDGAAAAVKPKAA